MEPTNKKKSALIVAAAVLVAVLLITYLVSLKSQLQQARTNEQTYAAKIQELQSVQSSEAMKTNRDFIRRFFDYRSTKQRYESIRSIMTDRGYRATFPSGFEPPDRDDSVRSSINGLKSYEFQESSTKAAYFNEFEVTTQYNKVSSKQPIIIRTELIYVQESGWRVNDVEVVSQP